MRVVNAVDALQVNKPDSNPIKTVRYPVEDGNLIQNVLRKRTTALQYKVINSTNHKYSSKINKLC